MDFKTMHIPTIVTAVGLGLIVLVLYHLLMHTGRKQR